MFKIGKVINYYEKIGITIVKLSAPLSVGDKIKFYKDGELILYQQIERIIMNQKNTLNYNMEKKYLIFM